MFPASRGWDSKPIDGVEVEGMGRAKGGKGERWKSERKGKEGGEKGGRGGEKRAYEDPRRWLDGE